MELTELCKLAEKYGTDKCPSLNHSYTPFYYKLFNPIRNEVKTIVEVGIGSNKPNRGIIGGASLRMWRDFFPNAKIYGIDIHGGKLVQDDRIESFCCDATDKESMEALIKKIGKIDIFIDDGSHIKEDQLKTFEIMKPFINDTIYIIEDVFNPEELKVGEIVRFSGRPEGRKQDNNLIIIK